VIYLNLRSGVAFGKLLDRLGISAMMSDRIIALPPNTVIENPDVVFDGVANGKGDEIGAYPPSMIMAAKGKGTKLIGPLPADYQSYLVLSAAMVAWAPSPDAAKQFIRFLVSPTSHAAFVAAGAD
jgi:molybdate transport system substrate-binding protein